MADIRYREIAAGLDGKDLETILRKKPRVQIPLDIKETCDYLHDDELGVLFTGLLTYTSHNIGKSFDQFNDPPCVTEAIEGNRTIGIAWVRIRAALLDDLMRYTATSIVNARNGRKGGQAKAASKTEPQTDPSAEDAAARQEASEAEEREADEGICPRAFAYDDDPGDYPDVLDGVDPETGEIYGNQDEPDQDEPDEPEYEGDFNADQFSDYEPAAPRPRLAYAAGAEDMGDGDEPLPFN